MYKSDKIIIFFIFIGFGVLFYYFPLQFNDTFYSNVITFLSISFGFVITSLSILYNSQYIKELYNSEDDEDKNITALHRLGRYYRINIYFTILLILYYIISNVIITQYEYLKIIQIINIPLLICNCYITSVLIKLFIKLFTNPNYK